MASITLTGTLLDPTGEVAVGDQIRFTHRTTTGETIQNARSIIIIPPTGLYNFPLEFGLIFVEYLDVKDVNYKNLGVVTVNQDTTATDLPGLLNAIVPPTDAQLLLFQGILADTEDARDIALLAAAQQTMLELIASTTTHPAGTVLTLSGETLSGDGGGGKWKLNGVVGQTVSQSPTDLDDFLLNDGNGNQWALVFGQILAFDGVQYLPLPFGDSGNGNYSYDVNGWTRVSAKVIPFDTLADAIVSKSVFNGAALNIKERSTGNGGGAIWDVVLKSTVTINIFNPVASTGDATLALVLRQHPDNSIDMWGAASGVNSSAAINAAIAIHAGQLKAEKSGYLVDSQVLFASGPCTGLKALGVVDSPFVKTFNGDAMRIQNQGLRLEGFEIQGDGSNFTGGGVYVVSDDCVINIRVTDTADSCIICQANNAKSLKVKSFLTVTDIATTHVIRSDGTDLSGTPTSRTFELTGGSNGPDFSGMNVARLENTLCQNIKFDADSDKITFSANRFTNASDIIVFGDAHTFGLNQFGFSTGFNLIFDASCRGVKYDDSNINSIDGAVNSVVQDDSPTGNVGTTNSIAQEFIDWSGDIEWKTGGDFGNSGLTSSYAKDSRGCHFNMSLLRGSTATNPPSGAWTFTLPFKALTLSTGPFVVKSSDGTWYTAIAVVQGGSNEFILQLSGDTVPLDNAQIPFSTNAQIQGTMIFQIAPV